MKSLRLMRLHERARTSLWMVPGSAAVAALVLARVLPALEDRLEDRAAWYLLHLQPDSARDLLSTIAASMMTFTGLVFSITILVLQLASSQFSPRVIGTFLVDRLTRIAGPRARARAEPTRAGGMMRARRRAVGYAVSSC